MEAVACTFWEKNTEEIFSSLPFLCGCPISLATGERRHQASTQRMLREGSLFHIAAAWWLSILVWQKESSSLLPGLAQDLSA